MEKLIRLNEEDIAQIIANYFDVDRNKVALEVKTSWEGYGLESQVHRVEAMVKED